MKLFRHPDPAGQRWGRERRAYAEAEAKFQRADGIFSEAVRVPPIFFFGINLRRFAERDGSFNYGALRFASALRNAETGHRMPALLALASSPEAPARFNKTNAMHLHWLEPDPLGFRAAKIARPVTTSRWLEGGAIPIWSGAVVWDRPAETVAVAASLPTALSLAAQRPAMRIYAVARGAQLDRVALPARGLYRIALASEHEGDAATLRRVAGRLRAEGLETEILLGRSLARMRAI